MTKNGNSIFIFCNIYCTDASSTEGCWDKKVLSDKPLINHFIIKTNPTHQVRVRSGVGKPFHKEPCGFCSIEGFCSIQGRAQKDSFYQLIYRELIGQAACAATCSPTSLYGMVCPPLR